MKSFKFLVVNVIMFINISRGDTPIFTTRPFTGIPFVVFMDHKVFFQSFLSFESFVTRGPTARIISFSSVNELMISKEFRSSGAIIYSPTIHSPKIKKWLNLHEKYF
jgi:hypothetical protein